MEVTPAPPDFLKIPEPKFVNGPGVPRLASAASPWQSQVPKLSMTAELPIRTAPLPVQVVVPDVLSVREPVMSRMEGPVKAIPPLAFVIPAPVIVPLVQVVSPDTLTVSVP